MSVKYLTYVVRKGPSTNDVVFEGGRGYVGQNGEIRRGGEGVFREKRRRIFKFRRFLIQQIFRKFITNAHMGNIFFQMLPICNRLVVR